MAARPVGRAAAAAFAVAMLLLVVALAYDLTGSLQNLVADVLLAAVVAVGYRTWVLVRRRRRYAREVTGSIALLDAQLGRIAERFAAHHGRAAELAVPAGFDDWFLRWSENVFFYTGQEEPERPATLPTDLPAVPGPAELLAAFDALRAGYAGPDLAPRLEAVNEAVGRLPDDAWQRFALGYRTAEALAPGPLMPGLPVSAEGMQARHEEQDRYEAAAAPLAAAAAELAAQNAAVQAAVAAARSELVRGYDPQRLARRDTPDPFPGWVMRTTVGAAAVSVAAWGAAYLFGAGGAEITDNVLVGLVGVAAGAGLTGIAERLAGERLRRESTAARAQVVQSVAALSGGSPSGVDPGSGGSAEPAAGGSAAPGPGSRDRAELRAARDALREALRQLAYLAVNRPLSSAGELALELVDRWLAADRPDRVLDARKDAALAQVAALTAASFPARS